MLNAAAIIAEAEARVGIADSETHLHAGLEALVAALNANPPQADPRAYLTHRTAQRIEGQKWLRDHPEIADEVIEAPLFLTGLPRSGTTFFQYLFDRDARFRLIRTWEGSEPHPPPGFDPASARARKSQEADHWRASGREALHLRDPDGPEECHAIMEQAHCAAGFHNLFDVPDYFDWLLDSADFEAACHVHKRQLQLLQWQLPRPRWAVKYPNHVLAMDAILAVYPDARFVMTHRDPVQTLASIAKMSLALRTARYSVVDPHNVGRQMLHFVTRHIERIMAFARGPHADRVAHVDYYRLLADPAAAMRDVHAGLGIDSPDAVRQSVLDWQAQNPKGARGTNAYTLGQFGLDEDEALAGFADYIQHFNIPREADGP
jgi:Sulfotransferase family